MSPNAIFTRAEINPPSYNSLHIPTTPTIEISSQANMKPTKLIHLFLGIALAGAGVAACAGAIEEIPPVVNLAASHRITNEVWCSDNGTAVVLEMMPGGQWSPIADRTLFAVRLNEQLLPLGQARFGDNTVTVCVKNPTSWSILAIGPGSLGEIIMVDASSAGDSRSTAKPTATGIDPAIAKLNLTQAQANASQRLLTAINFGLGAVTAGQGGSAAGMFSDLVTPALTTFSSMFSSASTCMREAFRDELVAEAGARKVMEIALATPEAEEAWRKLVDAAPKMPAAPCEP